MKRVEPARIRKQRRHGAGGMGNMIANNDVRDEPLRAAVDAVFEFLGNRPEHSIVAAKCIGLMYGYHAQWKNAGYVPLAVEHYLEADLTNPETLRTSRTFKTGGLLDVIVRYGTRRFLFDHKTTSEDIEKPDAPYWRQLTIEGQVTHYMLLGWLNGIKFDGAVWDVIRKPSISPKKLGKKERASVVSSGKYFNWPITEADRALIVREERETPSMYAARLANDCTEVRPGWYFQRRSIPRMDHEVMEYAAELWDHGQEILSTRNSGRTPRNSGACMLYGSPCKFLGICSGHDTPDSDKWRRKECVHSELNIEGDGRDILTNSRIRCFQTCRQKHAFEYELGIERQDEQEREALFFGSCFHVAQAAWWSTQLEVSYDDCNESAGIESANCGSGHGTQLAVRS